MPSHVTHYLHGRKALKQAELLGLFKVKINEDAFYMGTQGPDFFFSHRFLPWKKGDSLAYIGHEIHKLTPSQLIMFMREYVSSRHNIMLFSYYLGFVCHYSLDSIAHPYINFLSIKLEDNLQNKNIRHGEIESGIDAIMSVKEGEKNANFMRMKNLFPKNKEFRSNLADMYVDLIKKFFGVSIDKSIILETFSDARETFDIRQDNTGLKRKVVDKFEKGKKHSLSCYLVPANLENDVYTNINKENWLKQGETVNLDFYELFDIAVKRAVKLFTVKTEQEFIEATNNESFA